MSPIEVVGVLIERAQAWREQLAALSPEDVSDLPVRIIDNREMAWPGVEGLGPGRYLVIELLGDE